MMSLPTLALCAVLLAGFDEPASSAQRAEEPALRAELLRRMEADQAARLELVEWIKRHGANDDRVLERLSDALRAEHAQLTSRVQSVDAENTRWLKPILEKRGWPTRKQVGKDGAQAAWLLVQHADADPGFQRACLDRIAKLPSGEVSPADVALLTDRVLLAEGQPQRYGTQFVIVQGRLQPRPLADPETVDQRRAAAGLPPLAEYIQQLEQLYGTHSPK